MDCGTIAGAAVGGAKASSWICQGSFAIIKHMAKRRGGKAPAFFIGFHKCFGEPALTRLVPHQIGSRSA